MKKRIILTVLALLAVVALLAGIKALQVKAMIDAGKKYVPPPETVTTTAVKAEEWSSDLTAVGTLTAVQGVVLSAELPGKVVQISFTPGSQVHKGQVLLRQDTSSEEAQLPGALAQVKLARANLKRADQLFREGIISQADHDTAVATADQSQAQADSIKATIAKKSVRAPFSGQLGIRQANLGQILKEGDPIVVLQSLDPVYVDFTLPQQTIGQLHTGQTVKVTADALPGTAITGRVTAISPQVDAETRNVKLQATVANRGGRLRPGMFVNVALGLPTRRQVLTIPATAVLYAPFGDSVYIVEDGKEKTGGKVLRQQFVRLGDKRGDFVAVTNGLKGNETIVSSGVFKLRNGQAAVVDNRLAPPFKKNPTPENN